MQIFIKTLGGKTIALAGSPLDSVASLKEQILAREGIPPAEQRLAFAGKPLEDGCSLAAYSIRGECTLDLGLRLRGGHCQVPCGIFDDPKLVAELKEACATVRKAAAQIVELCAKGKAGSDPLAMNQMSRWVTTKEEHCGKIIDLVTNYCLCQRVKPLGAAGCPFSSEKEYMMALKAHHAVMTCAMKSKQSVEEGAAGNLEHAVEDCCKMYLPSTPRQTTSPCPLC